jgi:hypothetical protein
MTGPGFVPKSTHQNGHSIDSARALHVTTLSPSMRVANFFVEAARRRTALANGSEFVISSPKVFGACMHQDFVGQRARLLVSRLDGSILRVR